MKQQQEENQVQNLKELAEKISDKSLLEKVRKLKTYPCDTNNFSKIVAFKDTSFVLDVEKQDEIGDILFTKSELKKVSNSDFMNCIMYAYVWTYGFKDEDNKYKITPNVQELNIEASREDVKKLSKMDDEALIYKLADVKEDELSDWEKELVSRQVFASIYEPANTTMGLVLKL